MKWKNGLVLSTLGFLAIACSKDEIAQSGSIDDQQAITSSNATAVSVNTFIGSWDLSQLTADNQVDLNGDGGGSNDLMSETTCFDSSGVVFREDGSFTVTNSSLDFKAGVNDDEFACGVESEMDGTWEVEDGDLVLHFTIDGTAYTQRKVVDLDENSFAFDVSKVESDQYIGNSEGTVMEETEIISLEYTRAE